MKEYNMETPFFIETDNIKKAKSKSIEKVQKQFVILRKPIVDADNERLRNYEKELEKSIEDIITEVNINIRHAIKGREDREIEHASKIHRGRMEWETERDPRVRTLAAEEDATKLLHIRFD